MSDEDDELLEKLLMSQESDLANKDLLSELDNEQEVSEEDLLEMKFMETENDPIIIFKAKIKRSVPAYTTPSKGGILKTKMSNVIIPKVFL